jgi:hypothetical protein
MAIDMVCVVWISIRRQTGRPEVIVRPAVGENDFSLFGTFLSELIASMKCREKKWISR